MDNVKFCKDLFLDKEVIKCWVEYWKGKKFKMEILKNKFEFRLLVYCSEACVSENKMKTKH